jgi:hypothetical protein
LPCSKQAILHRPFHRLLAALWRVLRGQVSQPIALVLAKPLDDVAILELVHVGAAIEGPNLSAVAATVVIVPHVHRHVHVLDGVNEEPQGEPTILDGLGFVLQSCPELVDLVDDATVFRIVR